MIDVTVITRDGTAQSISAAPGLSLMEAIRKSGIDELVALCGGQCSCATCHVFVEQGPEELSGPASEDEDDLLESAESRAPSSRLSCQIRIEAGSSGLTVRIAPED
jgi:2Fe-2S ferredoxin